MWRVQAGITRWEPSASPGRECCGKSSRSSISLQRNNLNNFAPRVGFAYDPTGTGRTVIRGGYGMYYDQLFMNINLFAFQQSNPAIFGTVANLVNNEIGVGDLPNFVVNVTPLPPKPSEALTDFRPGDLASGRLVDPFYVNPLSQQFNIGFSHEFMRDYVLEVDYTHLLNLKESRRVRLNYKVNGVRRLTSAFQAAGIDPTTWGDWIQESSVNRSRYDGFNIGVRKRLSHRITFQTSYVYSKARGYAGRSGEFGATALDEANYLAPIEFAPTVRDERHRFVWSGVFDLPWGFQVSPILQLASARPYAVTAGTDVNGDGITNDLCVPGTTGNSSSFGASFVCTNPTLQTQRGGYDLDGNWQSGRFFVWDLRTTKFVNLGGVREGMNLGFYFEMFNLTNRTNYGNYFNGNIRASNFLTTRGPSTTTYGLDASAPFQAQVGVRFTF